MPDNAEKRRKAEAEHLAQHVNGLGHDHAKEERAELHEQDGEPGPFAASAAQAEAEHESGQDESGEESGVRHMRFLLKCVPWDGPVRVIRPRRWRNRRYR